MAVELAQLEIEELIRDGALLINDGYRAKNTELASQGIPFARAGNIDGGFHFEDADRVPPETLRRVGIKRSKPGDVVFTSKGTVGRFAFVRSNTPEFVYSPQLCFWRSGDETRIHPRWLYYWMNGREFYLQFKGVAGQTDMAEYVSLRDQRAMKMTLPPLTEQKAIAAVLGALDDKIELNWRMNATLEAMARALFQSWFVNFDPVRVKLDGSQQSNLDPATAALFPDSFQNSKLGPIPSGWSVGTIEEATSLIIDYRGRTPKKMGSDWSPTGIPAVSAKNVKGGRLVRPDTFNFVSEELYERWMKDKLALGDILMTSEAPLGELYYLALDARYCLSQRIFALRANPAVCESTYLYYWLESPACQTDIVNRGTGTTVEGIRQSELRKVSVLLPPLSIQKAAATLLAKWTELIHRNEEQSKTLADLRDGLLPKLLSGELSVPEVESIK